MRLFLALIFAAVLSLSGCGGGGSDPGSSSGGSGSSGSSSGSSGGSSSGGTPSAPAISSLSPAGATAGGAAFTLTVNGSNFVSSSVADWAGAGLATTYVSATQLTAQVPAADIAAAGSASSTVVNPAASGGASKAATFTIGAAPGSGPALVQHSVYQTQSSDTQVNSTVSFNSPTKQGDMIWVAVTVSDYAGVHQISVSDTQGNTYTLLDQVNDPQPGAQTVAQFYAANIAGDGATPDTVTVNWNTDDYKGVLIAEISGTTAAPLVGHASNDQDGNVTPLSAGSNNVTAGPITITSQQAPALLVALSMDTTGGSSDLGGSGASGPAAGTGMTQVDMIWDWGANVATFITAPISGAESATAEITATAVADSYATVAAVFY